ncbi:nephrin isoform X2 [Narcine bancroftii]|uniref:nephrin isoform X2 n=1 Tax=Narcine bancroftii TaxID=1343680 RepID=UPI003831364F
MYGWVGVCDWAQSAGSQRRYRCLQAAWCLKMGHPLPDTDDQEDGCSSRRWLAAHIAETRSWLVFLLFLSQVAGGASRQWFLKEPQNVTSIEGEVSMLECEVEAPSGVVQWMKDGLLLGPGRDLPGFPRYSVTGDEAAGVFHLQVSGVRLSDEGWYQCQAGQSGASLGIVSQMAWLEVLVPPGAPSFQELATGEVLDWVAGEEYSLTCCAADSKPESSVVFSKNGVEISTAETLVIQGSKDKVFSTVSTFRFIAEPSDNGKELRCSAINEALTEPKITTFSMNVLYPPQKPKVKGYDGHLLRVGNNLKLTCTSRGGNPSAALQWMKGEETVSRIWETDESTGILRSVLSYEVTQADNGVTLACEVSNRVTHFPLRTEVSLRVMFSAETVSIAGSSSALEGEGVSVSCTTSSSNPPARIQWWGHGVEFNISDVTYREADNGGMVAESNMSFVIQRSMDGTGLVCEALNEATLERRSAHLTIYVLYPPEKIWIQGPGEDTPFQVGTSITLSCFCSGGNPPATLVWTKDSTAVFGATPRTLGSVSALDLTFTSQPSDNQAEYRCTATHPASEGTLSAHTHVTVQFAPTSLTIVPPASGIHEGDGFTLVCQCGSSNPAAEISWVKDGKWIPGVKMGLERAEFGGWSVSSSLTLLAVAVDNGRHLSCRAETPVLHETLRTFHTLNILHAPRFQDDQVWAVEGQEHGAVVIPLQVSANPEVVTYTWSLRGESLVKDGPTRHHLKADGSLEIWNLSRFDAGTYRISVSNFEGVIEAFIKLEMIYSPRVSSISDPTEVEVGGSVEMVCTVDANPVRSGMVRWNWVGRGREVNDGDQIFEGNTTRLVLGEVTRSDAGTYQCSADNGIKPGVTASARLIVLFKPMIQKGVGLQKVAVVGNGSKSAILRCKAEGVPDVEFSWAKNGVTLGPEIPRYSHQTTHEGPLHTSELRVGNASALHDFGRFTCTARNSLGSDVADVQLIHMGPPDPPSNLMVLRVSQNSITLAWIAGFNGGVTQTFRVRYAERGSRNYLYADVYPPQDTTFTITGLRPGSQYNFSVNAINQLGASSYADGGLSLTVSTPGQSPFTMESLENLDVQGGGLTLPLPILIPLIILAISLLLLNIGILLWILRKMRVGHSSGTNAGKMKSFGVLELNDYGEDIQDITSDKSMFLKTSSEPSNNGSYDNCSSQYNQRGPYTRPRTFQETGTAGHGWLFQATLPDPRREFDSDEGIYEDVFEDPSFLRESSVALPSSSWPRPLDTDPGTVWDADRVVEADRSSGLTELLGELV